MRLAVLADTHITRTGSRALTPALHRALEGSDAILHAGDIVVGEVLEDLARIAPVHAVLGNNDEDALRAQLPEHLELTLGETKIGMVHDSGQRAGRDRRLQRLFPDCAVVVYGHSHIPDASRGVNGQLLFNPGSPTDKRRQPHFTVGFLDIDAGAVRRARHVILD
ncbi:MAG TPA: metallophosphoesterase family protein [Actinomycetota bacterium]|nr:metallophosphoesterase family protein [Actinomycetota bacterium]